MTWSMQVSRPTGGPLELHNPPDFEVIKFDPGEAPVDLVEIEGDYQHGSAVLGYRLRTVNASATVKLQGSSVDVVNNAQILVAAFRQLDYTVRWEVAGGAVHEYRCHPASVRPVRGMDGVDVGRDGTKATAVWMLTFRRQPIPVQGVA